jgi:S-formylglutathione hydrolase FrmB
MEAEYAYKFYQDWTSGRLSRVLLVEFQHPTPYYDDSYAVNTANEGPYGDAITKELIPYIEKQFRGIGQSWARAMFGGSTGGWESLAAQIFYPDFFKGAWACCPDPVDFRAHQIVNIYKDSNAFWREGHWDSVPQPDDRDLDDRVDCTMEQVVRLELVLGTHGRSARDQNNWQAVFGPVGPDGYPKPIWDPTTGIIDHEVAEYWREHYDLRYILERDWKTLGPKLVGKIHIVVGSRDTFYLDNAVRLLQGFLESTNNPYYAGYVKYGPHQPHGYSEDPHVPAELGSLVERQRVLPEATEWMLKSAPAGADTSSWRY